MSAGWAPRAVAYAIDLVAIGVPAGVLVDLFIWGIPAFSPLWSLGVLPIMAVGLLVLALLESSKGLTPGKWLLGLRTQTPDGKPTLRQAIWFTLPKTFPPLALADWLVGAMRDEHDRTRWTQRRMQAHVVRI